MKRTTGPLHITGATKQTLGVYAILNKANQKVFIGSGDLYWRKAVNWSLLRSGKHHNDFLQKEWNIFGGHNFAFVPLFECKDSEDIKFLSKCEHQWITLTSSTNKQYGYNLYKRALNRKNFKFRIKFTDEMYN